MTKSNHPRRIAREAVLQALYAYEITKEDRSKVLQDIINRNSYDNEMQIFITTLFNFLSITSNGAKSKLNLD